MGGLRGARATESSRNESLAFGRKKLHPRHQSIQTHHPTCFHALFGYDFAHDLTPSNCVVRLETSISARHENIVASSLYDPVRLESRAVFEQHKIRDSYSRSVHWLNVQNLTVADRR